MLLEEISVVVEILSGVKVLVGICVASTVVANIVGILLEGKAVSKVVSGNSEVVRILDSVFVTEFVEVKLLVETVDGVIIVVFNDISNSDALSVSCVFVEEGTTFITVVVLFT
jgi:hypothetical protein